MALEFNAAAATSQYYTGPASIVLPNSDWAIVVGFKPQLAGSDLESYLISSGTFGAFNSLNLNVENSFGTYNVSVFGASAGASITFTSAGASYNIWSYISISRVGNSIFLRNCRINDSNIVVAGDYIATASVVGIGAVTLTNLRLGSATVGGSRDMHGSISQLLIYNGTFTANHLELIASGVKPNDPYLMRALTLRCQVKSTGDSGVAPSSLADLSGNSNNFTLASGAPTLSVNDTASQASNTYTASGSGVTAILYGLTAPSNVQISGKTAVVSSTNALSDAQGIWVRKGSNHLISGNDVYGDAPAGFFISAGEYSGTVLNAVTISGNAVRGNNKWYLNTPHGIGVGLNTSNSMIENNIIADTHVGIVAYLCASGTARGNLIRSVWGPACYAKGTTAFTFDSNIILIDKYLATANAALAGTYQDTTNCTAATFSNNIVIVKDASKLRALGQISGLVAASSTPQPVTFTNNIYIIPDTINVATAQLFVYLGTSPAAANYTYSQWLTIATGGASVTGDRIIQLSVDEINKLYSFYQNKLLYGLSSGLIDNLAST
jgi:parallel beta-helix repeat protein